jgi:hypothetical protein
LSFFRYFITINSDRRLYILKVRPMKIIKKLALLVSLLGVVPAQAHNFSIKNLCMQMVNAAVYGAGKLERVFEQDLNLDENLQAYPQLISFIKKYRCPAHLEFGAKQQIVLLQDAGYYGVSKLSCGLYAKGFEFDRIINAIYLQNVIDTHHLDCCMVPEKYLCKVDNDYHVVCQTLPINRLYAKSLTLQEVQQLAIIAQETGYGDWHTGNIVRCHGKIAFIDTENLSFSIRPLAGITEMFPEFLDYFNNLDDYNRKMLDCKFIFLCGFYACMKHLMQDDAKVWMQNHLRTLFAEKKPEYFTPVTMLYEEKLVLSDIDFNQVTRDYVLYHLEKNDSYYPNIEYERLLQKDAAIIKLVQERYSSLGNSHWGYFSQTQQESFDTDQSDFACA